MCIRDRYKETIDVKSSELVPLKCRVAGDSYVIIDGKCGETLIMKPCLSLIYTPVVIEEVVDSINGKCLYNKGDKLYIRESYRITEHYNDLSLIHISVMSGCDSQIVSAVQSLSSIIILYGLAIAVTARVFGYRFDKTVYKLSLIHI